jgi:hypothetical protein
VQGAGTSSTDLRAQMLELHCSVGAHAVEVQLSLKATEATGLITVVPAPLAPHISEAPKHFFALFGRKVIGPSAGANVELAGNSGGGWKWKSSMGGCNVELLQHSLAPWVVFEGMSVSYAVMADASQRIRSSDAYRGALGHSRRSMSHVKSSPAPHTPAHHLGDIAVDIPAQLNPDTKKENDSLRLLLGSYESHFARMRQQLLQLLPNGLISRDIDGMTHFATNVLLNIIAIQYLLSDILVSFQLSPFLLQNHRRPVSCRQACRPSLSARAPQCSVAPASATLGLEVTCGFDLCGGPAIDCWFLF